MAISYKKFRELLIDKGMKNKDLQKATGISSASVTKLRENENMNTGILQKIWTAVEYGISNIVGMLLDTSRKANS